MFVDALGLGEVLLDIEDVFSVLFYLLEEPTIVKERMAVGFYLVVPLFKHFTDEKFSVTNLAYISSVAILRLGKLPDLIHTFDTVCNGTEMAILEVFLGLVIRLAAVALACLLSLDRVIDVAQ